MKSSLERKFSLFWRGLAGPHLVAEFQFHPTRRWRFDFAHPASKTAFELQGGIWANGRHSRGSGIEKECEKFQEAALLGWLVIPFAERNIITPRIEAMIRLVKEREAVKRWREA